MRSGRIVRESDLDALKGRHDASGSYFRGAAFRLEPVGKASNGSTPTGRLHLVYVSGDLESVVARLRGCMNRPPWKSSSKIWRTCISETAEGRRDPVVSAAGAMRCCLRSCGKAVGVLYRRRRARRARVSIPLVYNLVGDMLGQFRADESIPPALRDLFALGLDGDADLPLVQLAREKFVPGHGGHRFECSARARWPGEFS